MYQEIITEIKRNLSGNKDLDRNYLIEQIENYKTHEFGVEIIRELSRMLWDCLTPEEQEEFMEISKSENPVLDILNEVAYHIESGENKIAFEKLKEFINTYPSMYEDDKVNEYHTFTNPLEELIFEKYIGAEKEVRYIPEYHPYVDVYYIYGYLLIEFQQFAEAEIYLKKALKINPVSARIILELSEIYKTKAPTFNKFYIYTTNALQYAYYPQDIARCYRNLGYFYIEENQFEIANALLQYSLNYELSPKAYMELEYLKNKGFEKELSDAECITLIKSKNIQIGVNDFIWDNLNKLAYEYEQSGDYEQSLYFYKLIYNLNKDEEILDIISSISSKINY